MKKNKIILLGILSLLSACLSQNITKPNSEISSIEETSQSQVTPTLEPTIRPTAYPLPEDTNYNRKVVYFSDFDNNYKLITINPDGTDEKTLTFTDEELYTIFISLDGKKVYYLTTGVYFNGQRTGINKLYSLNIDGTDKKILFQGVIANSSISRDRKKIIFQDNNLTNGNINIYDLEKENLTKLDVIGGNPSLSPDNSKITFSKDFGKNYEDSFLRNLYVSNADGTNIKLIGNKNKIDYEYPKWLPNGLEIIFQYGDIEKQKSGLYTISYDGSNLKKFPVDSSVAISPDGEKMAYINYLNNNNKSELIIANIDNSNPIKIMTGSYIGAFIWSSDSKKALFKTDQIFIINADGTDLKTLSPKDIYFNFPDSMPGTKTYTGTGCIDW